MILTTAQEIMNAMQARPGDKPSPLTKLAEASDPKAAWQIGFAIEALENVVKHYNDNRIKLLNKYGTPNEATGQYEFDNDADRAAFQEKLEQLLTYPLTLQIDKLQQQHVEAAQLSAVDLLAIRFLVEREAVDDSDPFADFDTNDQHD